MQVDPVARARAIVADCMERGADLPVGEPAPVAPQPRVQSAAVGPRQVAFGLACILLSVCLVVYTLLPQ